MLVRQRKKRIVSSLIAVAKVLSHMRVCIDYARWILEWHVLNRNFEHVTDF